MFVLQNHGEGGSSWIKCRPQESLDVSVEQSLAIFRLEQRDMLTKLTIDLTGSGRDDFYQFPQ